MEKEGNVQLGVCLLALMDKLCLNSFVGNLGGKLEGLIMLCVFTIRFLHLNWRSKVDMHP